MNEIIKKGGKTKICIPLTGKNKKEILTQAEEIIKINPDLVEWRVDYFSTDTKLISEMLELIKNALGELPLIVTFRTAKEGGEKDISWKEYSRMCLAVAEGPVEYIDIELYSNRNQKNICELVEKIHGRNVGIIGSNHHFDRTPSKDEMIKILSEMDRLGADVCKLAVMPKRKSDVENLIIASKRADEIIKKPIVTMSMGELGAITRVCPYATKSAMTFAAGVNTSAPGQMPCDMVRELLKINQGCCIDRNIALIGFMGTGKTTVSKALSRITGFSEVDVDQYIVEKAGMSIKDIFDQYGEEHFRKLETEALRELQNGSGKIISCGGGAVLKDENVDILKQGSVIVLLTATPETIFERVKNHTHRPILNGNMNIEYITNLMDKREPRYRQVADIKVSVDGNDRVMSCYNLLMQLKKKDILKPLN